jgi:hypothetical protein
VVGGVAGSVDATWTPAVGLAWGLGVDCAGSSVAKQRLVAAKNRIGAALCMWL